MIRKGCEAFLAHVVDTKKTSPSIQEIPTVCEFLDVFPEELLGLPLDREVEFTIKVMPGTAPISNVLYRMAPTEL